MMRASRSIKNANSDDICRIICNPAYTGMGEFPRAIPDEQWIKAATIAIEIDSKHHFLVNLSSSLEASFGFQLIGRDGWVEEIEALLQKYDVEKVLANLLEFLRSFFKKEVINKDIGKIYKTWLITTPIPVVIRQIINNLCIFLYIKILKSSKNGLLNPPNFEIKFFFLHVRSG